VQDTDITELNAIAGDAEKLLTEIRDPELQMHLGALRAAAEEVKRSWSGSNIGYHSRVYYRGMQPKPPNVEFSPEWGLMDRWPTHQPDPGWVTMDSEAVRQEIITRAGNPNLDDITNLLSPKGAATSILSAILSGGIKDDYLRSRLERIEKSIMGASASNTIFIGHGGSPLWRELKDFLKDRLGMDLNPLTLVTVPAF
jgi:hypothetical protein